MSLRVTLELSDRDLLHFRKLMKDARSQAAARDDETIIRAAEDMIEGASSGTSSDFVRERLAKLKVMIAMLRDEDWQIPAPEQRRVISALSYFSESEDLIPDHIPVIGFLDDAIMIELVVRELRHEIEAYEDFCRFRDEQKPAGPPSGAAHDGDAAERLAARRKALHERMRRRASDARRRRAASRGPRISLF